MTDTLAEILHTTTDLLSGLFEQMDWAEDEINRAQIRHPHKSDELWHAFSLVKPTADSMANETLYRSHVRELLDRVATGGDTRKATAVEALIGFRDASLVAPLNTTGFGAYMTLWNMVGMPAIDTGDVADLSHYRAIAGDSIDAAVADSMARTVDSARVLEVGDCCGLHHGDPAPNCKFYTDGARK